MSIKRRLWMIHYEPYVLAMEEKRQKRLEEQKSLDFCKKRRTRKPKENQPMASSFGEAMEKVVQEKKLSSKINYDVLKSLIEPQSCSIVVQKASNDNSEKPDQSKQDNQIEDDGKVVSTSGPRNTKIEKIMNSDGKSQKLNNNKSIKNTDSLPIRSTIVETPTINDSKSIFRRRIAPKVNLMNTTNKVKNNPKNESGKDAGDMVKTVDILSPVR